MFVFIAFQVHFTITVKIKNNISTKNFPVHVTLIKQSILMGFLKIDAGSDRKNQYTNDSLKFRQWEQKTWHHLTSSQQTAGVLTTQATKKTQSITLHPQKFIPTNFLDYQFLQNIIHLKFLHMH